MATGPILFGREEKVTLLVDVVIPCYPVDLGILDTILALKPSASCSVIFIVIIDSDNPSSPYVSHLQTLYSHHSHHPHVRIRVNQTNLGASASRNKGLEESAAEWAHFLDDIVPDVNLLENAEAIQR